MVKVLYDTCVTPNELAWVVDKNVKIC